jgi:hypothetical protein
MSEEDASTEAPEIPSVASADTFDCAERPGLVSMMTVTVPACSENGTPYTVAMVSSAVRAADGRPPAADIAAPVDSAAAMRLSRAPSNFVLWSERSILPRVKVVASSVGVA